MSKIQKKYSGEFKQKVVEDMLENKRGYGETERLYGITAHSAIQKWERIYLEEGVEGLYTERRGRATKKDNPNKGRPHTLNKQVEEDLIAEVQRLRMENDYLKKLNALVHQKEVSARRTNRK